MRSDAAHRPRLRDADRDTADRDQPEMGARRHARSLLQPLPPTARVAAAYARAADIAEEDIAINQGIGRHGLALIEAIAATKQTGERVNVLTHCNAGWLATVDWGTATAPIYLAHERGLTVHVWVDETRPAQSGRLAHRLGTRPSRRAAHGDPRQYRRPFDAARHGRSRHRRHRPGRPPMATSATRSALT